MRKLRKFGIELEGWSGLSLGAFVDRYNAMRTGTLPMQYVDWRSQSRAPNTWILTTDGSFTNKINGDKGYEIVSPPLEGDDGIKELGNLLSVIRSAEKMNGKNNRFLHGSGCSVHVHISIEDLDEEQRKKVYELYQYIEPELVGMFPNSRVFNKSRRGGQSFCAQIGEIPYESAVDPERSSNMKYHSVQFPQNIPTMEFRMHSATTRIDKIHHWIIILNELFDFAIENTLVSRMRRSKEDFLSLSNILSEESYAYFQRRVEKFKKQREKLQPF